MGLRDGVPVTLSNAQTATSYLTESECRKQSEYHDYVPTPEFISITWPSRSPIKAHALTQYTLFQDQNQIADLTWFNPTRPLEFLKAEK